MMLPLAAMEPVMTNWVRLLPFSFENPSLLLPLRYIFSWALLKV